MQNRQDLGKKSHYFTIISYKNMYIRANVSILVFLHYCASLVIMIRVLIFLKQQIMKNFIQ